MFFSKGGKMKSNKGFTLVEILIVVVILGILAAIVIPQFTDAATNAKESRLVSDLQSVRSQIELYKIQHNDVLPGTANSGDPNFAIAMTSYTDVDGALATTQAPGAGVYGPYVQKIPVNPWNDLGSITSGTSAAPGDDSSGWYFNTTTGAFNANDDETTAGGIDHSDL